MNNVIYCKYNQTRSAKYQTKTCIVEDDRRRYVYKSALGLESQEHVASFPEKYNLTSQLYSDISFLPVEEKDGIMVYPYITGKSLDDRIHEVVNSKEQLFQEIHKILETYFNINPSCYTTWESDEKFMQLFGEVDCADENCIRPVNLDVIFDNIIVDDNGEATAYDYEWTYDFAVPADYVLFRILSRIFDKYLNQISKYIDFEPFAAEFGIDHDHFYKYLQMEQHLLSEIYHDGEEVLVHPEIFPAAQNSAELLDHCQQLEAKSNDQQQEIAALKSQIAFLQGEVHNREIRLKQAEDKYGDVYFELEGIKQSMSWKLTTPLRKTKHLAGRVKHYGLKGSLERLQNRKARENTDYGTARTEEEIAAQRNTVFQNPVTISVVTPLFNTPIPFLKEMIDSVVAQTYEKWELCLVDFSDEAHTEVGETVKQFYGNDPRIRYKRDPENKGIAENTNVCIAMATGEYIGILDHDDILHPSAFFEVMQAIDAGSDFVYTDEVKFSDSLANLYAPNFKPDFARHELLAHNYICHLNIFKRELVEQVGGYRKDFDGSQDHDIVLRLTEVAKNIVHVPHILYYWRVHAASVASNIDAKPYATISGIKAVEEAYKRMGFEYQVQSIVGNIPTYRLVVPENISEQLRLIVWGRDAVLRNKTVQEVKGQWDAFSDVLEFEDFSSAYSYLKKADETKCLVVMAGTELPNAKDSIQIMLMQSRLPGVAAVDGKLIYPNMTYCSNGVVAGKNISGKFAFRGNKLPADVGGYENNFVHARNVTGVSYCLTLVSPEQLREMEKGNTKDMIWESNALGVVPEKTTAGQIFEAQSNLWNADKLPDEDAYYNPGIRAYGME